MYCRWSVLNVNVTLRPSRVCKVQKSSRIWSLIWAGSFSIKGQAASLPRPPPTAIIPVFRKPCFIKQTQGVCYNRGRKVPGEVGLGRDGPPPPPPARQNLLLHNPGPPEGLGTLCSRYVCYAGYVTIEVIRTRCGWIYIARTLVPYVPLPDSWGSRVGVGVRQ